MGKSCEGAQIHQRYLASGAHTKSQQPECHQMVGLCVLRRAPRLKGAHWSDDFHGIRVDNGAIAEAKNKREELNESQDSGSRQFLVTVPVIDIIH